MDLGSIDLLPAKASDSRVMGIPDASNRAEGLTDELRHLESANRCPFVAVCARHDSVRVAQNRAAEPDAGRNVLATGNSGAIAQLAGIAPRLLPKTAATPVVALRRRHSLTRAAPRSRATAGRRYASATPRPALPRRYSRPALRRAGATPFTPGSPSACENGMDGGACAGPWPRSGGSARG